MCLLVFDFRRLLGASIGAATGPTNGAKFSRLLRVFMIARCLCQDASSSSSSSPCADCGREAGPVTRFADGGRELGLAIKVDAATRPSRDGFAPDAGDGRALDEGLEDGLPVRADGDDCAEGTAEVGVRVDEGCLLEDVPRADEDSRRLEDFVMPSASGKSGSFRRCGGTLRGPS